MFWCKYLSLEVCRCYPLKNCLMTAWNGNRPFLKFWSKRQKLSVFFFKKNLQVPNVEFPTTVECRRSFFSSLLVNKHIIIDKSRNHFRFHIILEDLRCKYQTFWVRTINNWKYFQIIMSKYFFEERHVVKRKCSKIWNIGNIYKPYLYRLYIFIFEQL